MGAVDFHDIEIGFSGAARVAGPIMPSGVPLAKPRWFNPVCSAINSLRVSGRRSRGCSSPS